MDSHQPIPEHEPLTTLLGVEQRETQPLVKDLSSVITATVSQPIAIKTFDESDTESGPFSGNEIWVIVLF